jgi:hypothetical protein
MRKTVYFAAFLTILLLGLSGASDLWAAPGQSNPTVPTRTPVGVAPSATPRSASPTETPRPNPPANTPAPAPAVPTSVIEQATDVPVTDTPQAPTDTPTATQPTTIDGNKGTDDTPQAPTDTPTATFESVPSATAALTETLPTELPAAAAGETVQPTEGAGSAAPIATLVSASPTPAPVTAQRAGPGPSPLLLAGTGLLVIGLVVALGSGRRA